MLPVPSPVDGCCVLQLLQLEQDVVRGLVLRQPSLLARASEGLQSKVKEYADIFEDEVGLVSRPLECGFGGGRLVLVAARKLGQPPVQLLPGLCGGSRLRLCGVL